MDPIRRQGDESVPKRCGQGLSFKDLFAQWLKLIILAFPKTSEDFLICGFFFKRMS
jgi:hypothetical protein